jgi:tRNA dimethylallyltransferase
MLAGGFAEEVRRLLARGTPPDAPAWRTLGYREVRAWVRGTCDAETARAAVVRATRRFAKRQRTWFRREPEIVWRHPERERAQIAAEVAAFLA